MSRADKHTFPVILGDIQTVEKGMTLLEHYAGLAMQGFIASIGDGPVTLEAAAQMPANAARWSVAYARALIAELEKQP